MLKLINGKIDIPNATFGLEIQTYVLVDNTLHLLPFLLSKKTLMVQVGLKQVSFNTYPSNNKYGGHICGNWNDVTVARLATKTPLVMLVRVIRTAKGKAVGANKIAQTTVWLQAIESPHTLEINIPLPEHEDNTLSSAKIVGSIVKMSQEEVANLNLDGSPAFKGSIHNYNPSNIPAYIQTREMNKQAYTHVVDRKTDVSEDGKQVTDLVVKDRRRRIKRNTDSCN